jgi:DNA-directed RNA polymerase specialized sigma24 family protein
VGDTRGHNRGHAPGATGSRTTAAWTSSPGPGRHRPDSAVELLSEPRDDPLEIAERREDLRRLVDDVRRLARQRSALLKREIDGMSYADLAAELGVTLPSVKSLLFRARIALAEAQEAHDDGLSRAA